MRREITTPFLTGENCPGSNGHFWKRMLANKDREDRLMIDANFPATVDARAGHVARDRSKDERGDSHRIARRRTRIRLGHIQRELLRHSARKLAENRSRAEEPTEGQLRARLTENARMLEAMYRVLRESEATGQACPPPDQWLLDNYHLIAEHLESARAGLLPRKRRCRKDFILDELRARQHMYSLTREIVARLEGSISPRYLREFLQAYQTVVPLTRKELWTLPEMLRLALIEYLCRAALGNAASPGDIVFCGVCSECDASNALIQDSREAAIRNAILSLQSLDSLDWRGMIESQCAVERILRQDPTGVYAKMDFGSRDHYLHRVEKLARGSGLTERVIACTLVDCARHGHEDGEVAAEARQGPAVSVRSHVGYYLLGQGQRAFEERIGYRRPWKERVTHFISRSPFGVYVGAIVSVWLIVVAAVSLVAADSGTSGGAGVAAGFVLFFLLSGMAAHFAVNFVNWICTLVVPPRPMMRLDFSKGIPDLHRTLVAVPAIIHDEPTLRRLLRQLEVRYAANRDDNLLFALLTDFPDAGQERMPGEEKLLAIARAEIQRLNAQHCSSGPSIFYFLHRPRKWNPREGAWMGEERKRGKLMALNRLLIDGDGAPFSIVEGDLKRLGSVRYVMTLDADTQLPPSAGRKLAGCMAHPLNRPQLDARRRTVAAGFSLVQPRVGVAVPDAYRSIYSRLLSGEPGIDPYTGQISNLYFDAFDESSFIGKGIYEVASFERAVRGRLPDNRILSHDLIEGCLAGCGFANDVDLFESVPSRFLADMDRRHRWIRGDWQIAAWLGRCVPTADGKAPNPLSGLSRWKIFDNLRRSLTPLFQLGILGFAWLAAPHQALFWTLLSLVLISGLPATIPAWGMARKIAEEPWGLHLKRHGSGWLRVFLSEGLEWCALPYIAWRNLDAIGRVFYRVNFSRKNALEWVASSEAENRCNQSMRGHYAVMWPCMAVAAAVLALCAAVSPAAISVALPMLAAWIAGPWIAWRLSQPLPTGGDRLSGADERRLRNWARRTWHYFERHAGRENHGLPPDNVQDGQGDSAVRSTSPTNIGLGLLSAMAARDLGYLSSDSLLRRIRRAMKTMRRLDRFRGHFYNWYDLRTLRPLEPRYVSSIDSGNLWACLIVLRRGLEELPGRPIVSPRLLEGLRDTVDVIAEIYGDESGMADRRFEAILSLLRGGCDRPTPRSTAQVIALLNGVHSLALRLNGIVHLPKDRPRSPAQSLAALTHFDTPGHRWARLKGECLDVKRSAGLTNLAHWTQALVRQIADARAELVRLAYWASFLARQDTPPHLRALDELRGHLRALDARCTLQEFPAAARQTVEFVDRVLAGFETDGATDAGDHRDFIGSLAALRDAAEKAASVAHRQCEQIGSLAGLCNEMGEMDFRFLFNPRKRLTAIGFNTGARRRDNSYYDLLASESRLTSFLAVSHGQIPVEHWSALGRRVGLAGGRPMLLSWAGSMFEYLMPLLFTPRHRGTLLDASCQTAVRQQIRFARGLAMPWGISESCYHHFDGNRLYQYRAFGVPEMSMRQHDDGDRVVAPYASALALLVAPAEACANLAQLERLGCVGPCGFYDSIDFTPWRLVGGQPALCRIVMAHHSGMSLLAFANQLCGDLMQQRFLRDPFCEAHDLLLQERLSGNLQPRRAAISGEIAGRTGVRAIASPALPG
jgi:hypothetical protein